MVINGQKLSTIAGLTLLRGPDVQRTNSSRAPRLVVLNIFGPVFIADISGRAEKLEG